MLKRIIGSHFANYKEAWEANRLADLGMIHPILSRRIRSRRRRRLRTRSTRTATKENRHQGPGAEEGLGVRDEGAGPSTSTRSSVFRKFSD